MNAKMIKKTFATVYKKSTEDYKLYNVINVVIINYCPVLQAAPTLPEVVSLKIGNFTYGTSNKHSSVLEVLERTIYWINTHVNVKYSRL